MSTELKPLPYVALPQVCGACVNRCLAHATANPEQCYVSQYCEHGRALVTAQLGDHNGRRVIHAWNLTGPCTPGQANAGIRQAAAAVGAQPVDNAKTIN